jgi:hypothetical protein
MCIASFLMPANGNILHYWCHLFPGVTTYSLSYRNCTDKPSCKENSVTFDLEVVSLKPRALVIDNFLSNFEADEVIR